MNRRWEWMTKTWDRFHRLAAWASVPVALAQLNEAGAGQLGLGAPIAFLTAGVTSLGFFPLFAILYEEPDTATGSTDDVHFTTALRGGVEECLYRGLLLPAIGLGPQAAVFALAHATDFGSPGLKVARTLQCLLRGVAYGALAQHFGFAAVVVGVTLYDTAALVTVEALFRKGSARINP